MIRPDRMTFANVFLLKEDTAAVTRALAELEAIEVSQSDISKEGTALHSFDLREAAGALESLRSRVARVAQVFEVEPQSVPASDVRVDPERIAAQIEEEFKAIEAKAIDLSTRMAQKREQRERLDILAWVVAALEREGLDAATIAGSSYVAMELGAVSRIAFYRLHETAELAGHKVFSLGHFGDKEFTAAVTTPDRREELTEGLNAARFERVALGEEFFEDGRLSTHAVEMRMWQTREDVTETGLEILELTREHGDNVKKWRSEIEVNSRLINSMENYLQAAYTAIVTGWIPTKNLAFVRERLSSLTSGKVAVVAAESGNVEAGHGGHAHAGPPVRLSNPSFIRPFEFLVGLYGLPAYNGIDPTILLALTFTLLFGAMFGDVGQGGVLIALGALAWWAFRRGGALKDVGMVLVWCGCSAIVFGFLYGSVFGNEDILHPLWLRPMTSILTVLIIGVVLGAGVISLGIIVNVVQNLLSRNYKDALFGEWAASTLAFYWGVLFLFFLVGTGRSSMVTIWLVIGVLAPPLLATMFGAEIWDHVKGRASTEGAAGVISRTLELMLGSLTNTISFARVPAFALNHAALMSTVFVIAEMFKGPGITGTVVSQTNVVIGNILVILLEGLVVFIQAMRLQYYEFFGKFFHHQGRPFEPLSLRDGRSVA